MPESRRLIIDIGTNSVLALYAELESGKLNVISDKKKTTRLGESLLSTGKLKKEAIERTVDAVAGFTIPDKSIFTALLGTEALRIASNSNEFADLILEKTGQKLTILSGEKEAEISFLGTTYNLSGISPNIVHIDVGGGSTEITCAVQHRIKSSTSIPIGALKLRELVQSDTINAMIDTASPYFLQYISENPFIRECQVIATGGTITSAAAIITGQEQFNSAFIHGVTINARQMNEIAHRFGETAPSYRAALIPFDPERAELMLPGLGIFLALMSIIGKDSLVVSTGGLRYGAALYPGKITA